MIQAHSFNQDPVLVELVTALLGSSPQNFGQILVTVFNHYAELVVLQIISYIPARSHSDGRVTVMMVWYVVKQLIIFRYFFVNDKCTNI